MECLVCWGVYIDILFDDNSAKHLNEQRVSQAGRQAEVSETLQVGHLRVDADGEEYLFAFSFAGARRRHLHNQIVLNVSCFYFLSSRLGC